MLVLACWKEHYHTSKGVFDMRKVGLIGAMVVGAAVLSASPISVNWSATQSSPTLSQNKALAAIGKPLSAGSVAGVHRRQERRHATPPK
jgi:hypothetical protein